MPLDLSRRAWSIADLCAMLSSWLFQMMFVSGGKARSRLMVSLCIDVSHHLLRPKQGAELNVAYLILMLRPPSIFVHILKTSSPLLTLRTAPQTSSLASANWSPIIARSRSSQYRSATPFFNLMIHLPPLLLASSSHTGRMFFLNIW